MPKVKLGEPRPFYWDDRKVGYILNKLTGYYNAYDVNKNLKHPKKKTKNFKPGAANEAYSGFRSREAAEDYLVETEAEEYMATKNPRRKRKNSAIRMNPEEDKISITISGPAVKELGSDIAMLAAQTDIPNTRGNPRKRRSAVTRRTKLSIKKTSRGYDVVDSRGRVWDSSKLKRDATKFIKSLEKAQSEYDTPTYDVGRRKVPMATKMFGNPIHYPKTRARSGTHPFVGRPAKEKWWILDLMDRGGRKIKTEIGKGSKKKAETEAIGFIDHRVKARSGGSKTVKSAMLSGPYARKPTARTARK